MASATSKDFDILIKLIVLGNSGVRKTSCIHRFVDDTFCEKYISTVGIDFREKSVKCPENLLGDGAHERRVCLQVSHCHLNTSGSDCQFQYLDLGYCRPRAVQELVHFLLQGRYGIHSDF